MNPRGLTPFTGRTAVASTAGGTASVLGGGKFANGAVTGAFHHLVNAEGSGLGKKGIGNALEAIARSPIGYLWSLPNTALGLAWGGIGFISEVVSIPFTRKWDYRISLGHNAIQFEGHNLAGSAETLGNTISYSTERPPNYDGMSYTGFLNTGTHEQAHTYQQQLYGPAFLPIYLSLGIASDRNPFEIGADNYARGNSWRPSQTIKN